MENVTKIGTVQGIKTACLGMFIILSFPIIENLSIGDYSFFSDILFDAKNWPAIIYTILVMCICGIATGRFAANKIIKSQKHHINTGIKSSILSLILFAILMSFYLVTTSSFDGLIRELPLIVMAIILVGLIPAIIVGIYLGYSINKKRNQLQLIPA